MGYTKKQAIAVVVECAKRYRDELANKSLLFAYSAKPQRILCAEFFFYERNYRHLTGLKPSDAAKASGTDSAEDFYHKCLSHNLSASDFEFAEDGTTPLKLDVLPKLITKNLSASMLGSYDTLQPKLYTEKLAGGVKGCIGFARDDSTQNYVPNTVLKQDIRDYVSNCHRVIAVFRKKATDVKYEEITYVAKGVDLSAVVFPEDYGYLSLLSK